MIQENRNQSTKTEQNLNRPNSNSQNQKDANRDPISGEPGSHPLGTGVGAAGAGTVGTVAGAVVAGPIGGVVGAVVGSVIGGLVGKGTAETVNPTFEDNYWRENYTSRPYVEPGEAYEDYQLAYQTGYDGYFQYGHGGQDYAAVEPELKQKYEAKQNGNHGVAWEKAKYAVMDSWQSASASDKH